MLKLTAHDGSVKTPAPSLRNFNGTPLAVSVLRGDLAA